MTGSQLLILAIIIVFVVAFVITVWYLNAQTKQIIDTNSDLVEQHNTLLEKNRSQQDELEEQQEKIESLQKQQEEMAAMMREKAKDEVTLLRQQTQERRNDLLRTAEMSDEELLSWIDQRMNESRLFTLPTFTLKEMAKAVGLTQKRLTELLKERANFSSFNDYLTKKRLLLACELMRENPNWTIEAIAKESGFQTRRTFQEVVKTHLGMTPSQYRQTLE
jgi:AraC-like DNA-binding protein